MNDVKKLVRTTDGAMCAGVCAGLGRYLGIDATLIRLAWVAAAIFLGLGVVAYAICWVVIPEEQA